MPGISNLFKNRSIAVKLATIGLFALRAHGAKALLWIGILAGIGLFLIRLNGPDSWATGHLDYWISVR